MSDTVHYKGKLTSTGKTLEEYLGDVEIPNYCNDLGEYFEEYYYDSALVIDDVIWEIEKTSVDPYDDIAEASKNPDGTIDFVVRYYNGGTCFSEMLDEALENVGISRYE